MNFKKNKIKFILFGALVLVAICAVAIFFNIPFSKINSLSESSFITKEELNQLVNSQFFGPIVTAKIKNDEVIDTASLQNKINFEPQIELRLFDLIPIKTKKLKVFKADKVRVSGSAVGLVLKTDGVLVVGSSPVSTPEGEFDALQSEDLKIGDSILQIENQTIENVGSVSKIINEEENKGRELDVVLKRKDKEYKTKIKPCYDVKSESYKLGVWVRDDATGIGTLTFVDENNRFGALGHPICDSDTKSQIELKSGQLYNCSILGVNKGQSGKPGELRGLFMQGKNSQGVVEKNNDYGVFGNIKEGSSLFENTEEISLGGRLSVRPGRAQIRCCLDGNKVETFDIEIIKTNYQNYSKDKSMVLRVIDEDLIERTGGIVQGMSGSPIIQNGKIVGAVTHVFVSDPTKGFGVYIDWMLNQ